jgi:hypothetical protein
MTALFDIQTIRNMITFPFRLVFGSSSDFEPARPRHALTQRWRRGDDGKLEGRWND